ncbi:hypothetical protein [Acaryochloris sp. IP29b_bin.137]|uniref:hypothetical protein n=1 Tax=Acaryochloris sp. IP29b_bin.137 TaxID=2969217 RepID=UPI0026372544|nr:hypothetical protein [Acaryochloris sp. IP29b_bin.137]
MLSQDFNRITKSWEEPQVVDITQPLSGLKRLERLSYWLKMDIQEETLKSLFPNEPEQVKLVNESVLVFGESINDQSMEKFYSYISVFWQQQCTVQQLDKTFAPFYKLDLDLTVLKRFSPVFSKSPTIDKNGVLLITGFYPTRPQRFSFELKYLYEGLHWKLVGFRGNLNQETVSPLRLPSEAEQVKLVNESVLIFAASVNDKSMEKFYSSISVLWQQQCTIQQLDEAFTSLYKLDLDLTVLKHFSPIFNNQPSIEENVVMPITGFYPTQPKQVHFELKYLYEGQSWKLMHFSTNIK